MSSSLAEALSSPWNIVNELLNDKEISMNRGAAEGMSTR